MNVSKVLIVDDSRLILMALSRQLEKAGYQVVTQSTALGVLQTVLREQPQLMILDITMPDLQGTTLCRMLADQRFGAPPVAVVLHSALLENEMAAKAELWGAQAYMEKSWRLERKLEVIASLIGPSRRAESLCQGETDAR